ncbi:unnamed protein product [Strongylus vulgaris]|uniref:Ig-like domain-containing protein n=1 Tax=Strongylus vulgaris TaxID=40348 RepID=A0A3P7JLW8_STRVU|nr:unnamed protein product [Strongylus vulgaris]
MTVQQALQHPFIKMEEELRLRGQLTPQQKKKFMALRRWSDDLLPIGRLAKRGAIFRQQSMDGVFERDITFVSLLPDSDYAPSVKKQLDDIVAHVGDLIATLTCEIEGMPLPRIIWYKDGQELAVPSIKFDSQFTDGSAELTVKNLEQSDAGKYRCHAANQLGTVSTEAKVVVEEKKEKEEKAEKDKKVKKAKKVDFDVEIFFFASEEEKDERDKKAKKAKKPTTEQQQKSPVAPSFTSTLTDCSTKLGETLTLKVTSKEEVKVDWYHNSSKISETDQNYLQKHEKDSYELTIRNVNVYDEGEWRVMGRNAVGDCESSCSVAVEIPEGYMAPTFEQNLEDIKCEEQELLTLTVKIAANPVPEIIWYCEDKEIKHSDRYRILFDDEKREYSLIIVNAYAEDSGEYK